MQSKMMINEIIPHGKYYTALTSANDNQLHRHEFIEIFYVISGSAIHQVNDKETTIGTGEVCILRPSDFHRFISKASATFTHRDICVETEEFRKVCSFISPTLYETILSSPAFYSSRLDIDEMNFFEKILKTYVSDNNPDAYTQACRTVTSNIAFLCTGKSSGNKNFMPDWVQQLVDYLHSPYYYQLSVSELTQDIHFSKQYICHTFKKYVGMSVTEYFLTQRLNYAKYLILTTTDSIANISYTVGFNNVTFFYRSFKKHFSVTPMELRKKSNNLPEKRKLPVPPPPVKKP